MLANKNMKTTVALLTLSSTLSITKAGPTSPGLTCKGGNFTAGTIASVTCHFSRDALNEMHELHITWEPFSTTENLTDVVTCIRVHLKDLKCTVLRDGYNYSRDVISNRLTFWIPEVTAGFAGRYSCQLSMSVVKPENACYLYVHEENQGLPTAPFDHSKIPSTAGKTSSPDKHTFTTIGTEVPNDPDATPMATTKIGSPVPPSYQNNDSFVLLGGLGAVLILVVILFGILFRRTARQPLVLPPPLCHNIRREAGIAVEFRPVPAEIQEDNDSFDSVSTHCYAEIPEDTETSSSDQGQPHLQSDSTLSDDYASSRHSVWDEVAPTTRDTLSNTKATTHVAWPTLQTTIYQNTTDISTRTVEISVPVLDLKRTTASEGTLPGDFLQPITWHAVAAPRKDYLQDDYHHPLASRQEGATANITLPDDYLHPVASRQEGARANITLPDDYLHPVASRQQGATANITLPDDYLQPVASRQEGARANITLPDDYLHPVTSRQQGATANITLPDDYLHPVTSRQEGATANITLPDDYLHPVTSRLEATAKITLPDDYLHPVTSRLEATAKITLPDDYLHPVTSRLDATTKITLPDDYLQPVTSCLEATSAVGTSPKRGNRLDQIDFKSTSLFRRHQTSYAKGSDFKKKNG